MKNSGPVKESNYNFLVLFYYLSIYLFFFELGLIAFLTLLNPHPGLNSIKQRPSLSCFSPWQISLEQASHNIRLNK